MTSFILAKDLIWRLIIFIEDFKRKKICLISDVKEWKC